MKRTIIHTSKYKTELAHFAQSATFCTVKNLQTHMQFIWESPAAKIFAQALMLLLHKIAMAENPVYRHSPKLRDLADGLLSTDTHTQALAELTAFLKANKEINLEGYVIFRMEEYRAKLDMLLYTIMKKINLSKH